MTIPSALAACLAALTLVPPPPPGEIQPVFGRHGQEVFFAVLEGLYRDGVQQPVVERVLVVDEATGFPANFVAGCPVCRPVEEAFRAYAARPPLHDKLGRDTLGPGLPAEAVERLTAVDLAVVQAALEEHVHGWVERRMNALRLTEAERATWRSEMEGMRKAGMSQLRFSREDGSLRNAGMTRCPSCDGAAGACGALR